METRIIQKWYFPALGYVIALQKKTWYGWKTISCCYSDILLRFYGPDPKEWGQWLWWKYRQTIKEQSVVHTASEILKGADSPDLLK